MRLPAVRWVLTALVGMAATLAALTVMSLAPVPDSLDPGLGETAKPQLLDREGRPLTITYESRWNIQETLPLHRIPARLREAFLAAEDGRYYQHHGIDWQARLAAVGQNLKAGRAVRGASTISEQVARLITPRPRTLWSRWLEGFEAMRLERRFGKDAVLEFYLNQVPYAGQARGVAQAARRYFDRELDTLSDAECLALAVLVRAPTRLDPARHPDALRPAMGRLADRLVATGRWSAERRSAGNAVLPVQAAALPVNARAFAAAVYPRVGAGQGRIRTTLDSGLQREVQDILDRRLVELDGASAGDGAVLVVDLENNQVRAWVNARPDDPANPHRYIDAVTSARQPGSTLKPFVYALAMERGWTAATRISDSPLKEAVGTGLHSYRNYSRTHYGEISLREALGNSLNIPAVRALKHVGGDQLLTRLHDLGVTSLNLHPDHYGDGLALGAGELSLFELVQAYTALARSGEFHPLALLDSDTGGSGHAAFSPEIASLIADILSDPEARRREFGEGGLLRFPHPVAVKTGTSSDYRDAWAVGFDDRYLAGVWLGNLDRRAMREVTGATGPALVLRTVFNRLSRNRDTRPLWLSPKLVGRELCRDDGRLADGQCPSYREWFVPGTEPSPQVVQARPAPLQLLQPTAGLRLARDPRIPDARERFRFAVSPVPGLRSVSWWLDGSEVAVTTSPDWLWPLHPGTHRLEVRVRRDGHDEAEVLGPVNFYVR